MNWCIQILKKLLRDADLYKDLIPTVAQEIRVCVRLSDSMESATIIVADEMKVLEDSAKPDITLIMNSTALRDIVDGKADAFALIGRGRMDEKRPIEFEIHTKERTKEIWEVGKALLTYFFTPGKIKVKSLDPERAGHAHGAHPIPLVYWNGMRYSWILVKSGETLNKDGEKDPWPQAFVVLEGKGMATIRDTRFQIEAEKAIYVPTNSIHQITAEEDLKLLWLAWNAW